MTHSNGDDVRASVREHYGQEARRAGIAGDGDPTPASAAFGRSLYDAGDRDSLPEAALVASLGCGNPTALAELKQEYTQRGMRVQRLRDKVQLVTAPDAALAIEKFLGIDGSGHLSAAALETLAIIAYRQPVTRPAIEAVRGVNCDGVIQTLLSRGLIQETGRQETVGRPILYATTFEFLQNFGLRDTDDLPPLEETAQNVLSNAIAEAEATAQQVAERIK